jgi:hypothetical protein
MHTYESIRQERPQYTVVCKAHDDLVSGRLYWSQTAAGNELAAHRRRSQDPRCADDRVAVAYRMHDLAAPVDVPGWRRPRPSDGRPGADSSQAA